MKVSQCIFRSVVLFAVAASTPIPVAAQSRDRDHPTPIASPQISGTIDSTVAGGSYYYSVTAGPGDLAFTFDVESGNGRGQIASVTFEVLDVNSRSVFQEFLQSFEGQSQRRPHTVTLARKQPLLLRVSVDRGVVSGSVSGRYRVSLSGPIELARGGQPASSSGGKLRIEMLDGTIQEIDLRLVRRLVWEPAN